MQKNMKQPVIADVIQRLLDKQTEELKKSFATKDDLKEFATKEDLKDEIHFSEARIDIKLISMEQRIDDNAQKYRDQILTSNDKIIAELEQMREDRTVGEYQVKERLEEHEKRIKKLEQLQRTHQ